MHHPHAKTHHHPPREAHLATVDLELTQQLPNAIRLEITPDHIHVSLHQFATQWQRASDLQDAKILNQGPWWCTFLRERCLQREKKPHELSRLAPLPVFAKIPIQDGIIRDSMQKGPQELSVIQPVSDQLHQAYQTIERILLSLEPQARRQDIRAQWILAVAVDERIPMSTISKLFSTAKNAETSALMFLVNSPESHTQAVYYQLKPFPMLSGVRYQDDIRTSCAAAPEVILNPQAVTIKL